eukprot:595367-Prorocentrum_minimum.AAC.1
MWGEHMHHGYYEVGQPVKDHREAQVDMVTNALKWAGVESAENVLDVGCGIGGSSRLMAKKFGCAATGITLSPKQAARANAITAEAGIPNVSYQVRTFQTRVFQWGQLLQHIFDELCSITPRALKASFGLPFCLRPRKCTNDAKCEMMWRDKQTC